MLLKKMATVTCVLGLTVGSVGCKPKKGTANPGDYFPLILVAMESGKTAAMIGRNEAIAKENFAGCVASEVLISATDAAGEALVGHLGGTVVIPGIDVDLSDCMPLNPKDPKGAKESVGMIVEQVVGVALGLGSHYAAQLETADCKKGKAALGAIAYLQGLVGPIAEEVTNPDGVFALPAMEIPLSACEAAVEVEEVVEEEVEEAVEEAPPEEAPAEAEAPADEAPAADEAPVETPEDPPASDEG
jgi:hypothetical protein